MLAIIPARSGSKGIPGKNWKPLHGLEPAIRAWDIARKVTPHVYISTDREEDWDFIIRRPPELAQDDTPMIAVVRHVLEQIPGPHDQQIVLLQPTQPLREPKHITQALELLTPEVDSVVSVVRLPLTHAVEFHCHVTEYSGLLDPLIPWKEQATRRQMVTPSVIRDGTCYAFWRKTVEQHGDIYGNKVVPLIIHPKETCPLDTEADWLEAERRLKERG